MGGKTPRHWNRTRNWSSLRTRIFLWQKLRSRTSNIGISEAIKWVDRPGWCHYETGPGDVKNFSDLVGQSRSHPISYASWIPMSFLQWLSLFLLNSSCFCFSRPGFCWSGHFKSIFLYISCCLIPFVHLKFYFFNIFNCFFKRYPKVSISTPTFPSISLVGSILTWFLTPHFFQHFDAFNPWLQVEVVWKNRLSAVG